MLFALLPRKSVYILYLGIPKLPASTAVSMIIEVYEATIDVKCGIDIVRIHPYVTSSMGHDHD